ncbi:hypothetical protein Tco_1015303 [Tanacetum coccineum]|uniref:Uncharacterized protein n=1 Tax=Tanacetum coccineum TaxID=301880 RepID=A0ABQ5FKF3_9ASTR
MTRRRLHTNSEVRMYALTVSTTEPKNIKEAMLDHSWIESIQDELNQFKCIDLPRDMVKRRESIMRNLLHRLQDSKLSESLWHRGSQELSYLPDGCQNGSSERTIERGIFVRQPDGFVDPDFPNHVHQSSQGIFICQSQFTMDLLKKHGKENVIPIPCSPECKIVGQILLDRPLSYALTATADVSVRVGYQGVVDKVSAFYTKFLAQPWQTKFKKIPSIPQRIDEDYHSIKDDILLVSVYPIGNVQVRGMLIPDAFLTEEIRATDDYIEIYYVCEVEYIVAAEASMEAVWMRKIINGLGDVMSPNKRPIEMLCDNAPAIAIAMILEL